MTVRWSDDAKASLRALREDYNQRSRDGGTRLAARIFAGTRRLAQFPELGRVVPEYATPVVRELTQGHFRIWYVVGPGAIEIIAVFHGARNTR